MDAASKQALLDQFSRLLDSTEQNDLPDLDNPSVFELLQGSTNLSEVNQHLQQQTQHLQQIESALKQHSDQSQLQIKQLQDSHGSQDGDFSAMLKDLLVVRDRLHDGLMMGKRYRASGWTLLVAKHELKVIRASQDGQELSLKRLDQLLKDYGVSAIKTLGSPFDSASMCAVGMSHDAAFADGAVSKQLRTGYRRGEQLLRVAEVIVNRIIVDD